MPVLALDTSGAVAVAVTDDAGHVLAARSAAEPRRHAELLAPMIAEALAEAGLRPADVTAVVAGTGPAPFTGLRVGLVTARTFALALGVPVHGVPSLDALAAQAVRDLAPADGTEVLVVTDARRREVYWARYVVRGDAALPVDGPDVAAAATLAADELVRGVVAGRGAVLYPDDLPLTPGAPLDPDPADLAREALRRLAAGETDLPTEPLYLRRPDAVPAGGHKRASA